MHLFYSKSAAKVKAPSLTTSITEPSDPQGSSIHSPDTERTQSQTEIVRDDTCIPCRVIGTSVCGGAIVYMGKSAINAQQLYPNKPWQKRIYLITSATFCTSRYY